MKVFINSSSLLRNLVSRLGARAADQPQRLWSQTKRNSVHFVDSEGRTKPYGIPVQITEGTLPKRIAFFGGVSGCIAAIERFSNSPIYIENGTKLIVYVDANWKAAIPKTLDQPWGQEVGSLIPANRKMIKKMFPQLTDSDRLQISEMGQMQDQILREQGFLIATKSKNIEIIQGNHFDQAKCSVEYSEAVDDKYTPMLRIQSGNSFKEIPLDGTLVINNASVYGKLTTGNHDLTDVAGDKLDFKQGTSLFGTAAIEQVGENIIGVGLGLTYLWAASKLKQNGVNLIGLYDKNFDSSKSVSELVEANEANNWIKKLPEDTLNSLEVYAIQDCIFKKNIDGEYEVTLPTGEVKNVGNDLYDLTGYTPATELTQDLPDEVVYRPVEAGVFAFPHDMLRNEVNAILNDAGNLPEKEKNQFLELIRMVEQSHELRERLKPTNTTLNFSQFKDIQDRMAKNHADIKKFVKKCGGSVLAIFNRYETDFDRSIFMEHVPKGSAPYTYALASHQFGHIPNLSLFESHLIRSSHLFEVVCNEFKELTDLELTVELYDKYIEKLQERVVYQKSAIENVGLAQRVDAFKTAVLEVYPDILKNKLDEFCQLQGSYFKNSEKFLLASHEDDILHRTFVYDDNGLLASRSSKPSI